MKDLVSLIDSPIPIEMINKEIDVSYNIHIFTEEKYEAILRRVFDNISKWRDHCDLSEPDALLVKDEHGKNVTVPVFKLTRHGDGMENIPEDFSTFYAIAVKVFNNMNIPGLVGRSKAKNTAVEELNKETTKRFNELTATTLDDLAGHLKFFHDSVLAIFDKREFDEREVRLSHAIRELGSFTFGVPNVLPKQVKRGIIFKTDFEAFKDNYYNSFVSGGPKLDFDKPSPSSNAANQTVKLPVTSSIPPLNSKLSVTNETVMSINAVISDTFSTIPFSQMGLDHLQNIKKAISQLLETFNNYDCSDLSFTPVCLGTNDQIAISYPQFFLGRGGFKYNDFLKPNFIDNFIDEFCSFEKQPQVPENNEPQAPQEVLDTTLPEYEDKPSKDVTAAFMLNGVQVNIQSENVEQLAALIKLLV